MYISMYVQASRPNGCMDFDETAGMILGYLARFIIPKNPECGILVNFPFKKALKSVAQWLKHRSFRIKVNVSNLDLVDFFSFLFFFFFFFFFWPSFLSFLLSFLYFFSPLSPFSSFISSLFPPPPPSFSSSFKALKYVAQWLKHRSLKMKVSGSNLD